MKRYLLPVLLALTIAHLTSCSCHGTVQCGNGGLGLRTVGYTIADIDSMQLVTYKADNNFDSIVATRTLFDNYGYGLQNDTCNLDWLATAGNDYKIIFPTTGVTIRITKLQQMGPNSEEIPYKCEEGSPAGVGCWKTVTSFCINGQTYSSVPAIYTIVK